MREIERTEDLPDYLLDLLSRPIRLLHHHFRSDCSGFLKVPQLGYLRSHAFLGRRIDFTSARRPCRQLPLWETFKCLKSFQTALYQPALQRCHRTRS